jgi:hypothetical protein
MKLVCGSQQGGLERVPIRRLGTASDVDELRGRDAGTTSRIGVLRPDVVRAAQPGGSQDQQLSMPSRQRRLARYIAFERQDVARDSRVVQIGRVDAACAQIAAWSLAIGGFRVVK